MRVVFHRLAKQELSDAFGFYEDRSEGLGWRFLDKVERSTQLLVSFPQSAPVTKRVEGVTIRKRSLDDFPFDLVFTFDDESLFVLAVAHQKRRPGYWVGRT